MKKYFYLIIFIFSCSHTFAQCPEADAGPDQTVCANISNTQLSASYTYTTGGVWSTLGTGNFSDANNSGAVYYPSPSDIEAGSVQLVFRANEEDGCPVARDTMTVTITPAPTAYSGPPEICAPDGTVELYGVVTGATGGVWETSGTGWFIPSPAALNGMYAFSAADHAIGFVDLTLRTTGNGFCNAASGTSRVYNIDICNNGTVTGHIFYDKNGNGIQDPGEQNSYSAIIKFISDNGIYYAFSYWGYYVATLPAGEYTVVMNPAAYVEQTFPLEPEYYTLTVSNGSLISDIDFRYTVLPFKDLRISLIRTGASRPGFPFSYYIAYRNYGTEDIPAVTITLDYDEKLTFSPSGSSAIITSPTQLTWNIANLYSLQYGYIPVNFTVDAGAPLGGFIVSSASIFPLDEDDVPSNNTSSHSSLLIGSYDPNDKQVHPAGTGEEHSIYANDELVYTIRFQNTGTADAINVVIKDTIDSHLDLGTFRMLNTSHYNTVSVDTNRIITWTFENIHLPDSTSNEPESHGFLLFSLQQNPDNPVGTVIRNKAAIYFDFNEPIITNEVFNTIAEDIITFSKYAADAHIIIYPNPASDWYMINTPFENPAYVLTDLSGKIIREGTTGNGIINNISGIKNGIYMLKLISGEEVHYRKLMVK